MPARSRFLPQFASLAMLAALLPLEAAASFLSGDALDTMANAISWVVLIVVPIGAIVVFWMVHVLPEKIAHKRHHPQKDAIHTLCLLSLLFGGLLWPIAWLWAYTKPVTYKLAYGTDKHDDYFDEKAGKARAGEMASADINHLRLELEAMDAQGKLPARMKTLLAELEALHASAAAKESAPPPAEGGKA